MSPSIPSPGGGPWQSQQPPAPSIRQAPRILRGSGGGFRQAGIFASTVFAALLVGGPSDAAVEVRARVTRSHLTVGETTSLEVEVVGAVMGIRDPDFEIPPGLELLGSGRTQSLSAVNGQMSVRTVFTYEIAANRTGDFRLGPIRVQVGKRVYGSGSIAISVSAAERRLVQEAEGQGPASLKVDVSPSQPYVGQPITMRVRLIQRRSLAEDPQYSPPATTGFWAERASQPESYYADEAGSRVLVTETRALLYPLAVGETNIGPAVATLRLPIPGASQDPLQWMQGRIPRHEVTVQSDPVGVRVRDLPAGAPEGFQGAVGNFTVAWFADRARTTQDVPVTVRLEIRGFGNLPLIHAPALRSRDFEVFSNTVEDSLAPPGSTSPGRRRFQWIVLPRHQGRLELASPPFAWFDPVEERYRSAGTTTVAVDVAPPLAPGAPIRESFPTTFVEHPLDPFHRESRPWAFALAGGVLGAAFQLWRHSYRRGGNAAERARQREWMHAVGRSTGLDFWSAADHACEWLESHQRPVPHLRRQIEASRYGGRQADAAAIRTRLLEHLAVAVPAESPRWTLRLAAGLLATGALALCLFLGPGGGDHRGVARARLADQAARQGDLERARAEWERLWREGGRSAGLAARLAWAEMMAADIGRASLWVLRGDREEPRDPSLGWIEGQIREAGGLSGFAPLRIPVRRIEWAGMALGLGLVAALLWPRRWPATAALALSAAAAFAYPLQGWLGEHSSRGVVQSEVTLEGTKLELGPGQVVNVLERTDGRARTSAGRGVAGWVPLNSLEILEPTP